MCFLYVLSDNMELNTQTQQNKMSFILSMCVVDIQQENDYFSKLMYPTVIQQTL